MHATLRHSLLALALMVAACGGDATGPGAGVPTGTYHLTATPPGGQPVFISVFIESSSATNLGGSYSAPGSSGRFTDGAWQVSAYRLVMGPYILRLKPQGGAVVCEDDQIIYNPGTGAQFWPCAVTSQP